MNMTAFKDGEQVIFVNMTAVKFGEVSDKFEFIFCLAHLVETDHVPSRLSTA